ncbi:RNA polymerase sigma factor [Patulibacter defluvii]|uniref:RNA polymerase sigma factor n=1 Tax=Patulibacter defluvii TaxID=3095358 RepID=UPI002A755E22|nr:sigma-70 family RNA polymerase sigma factor [Patulibacter sp. DM4]
MDDVPSDAALVRRVRNGHLEAFEPLVARHRDTVVRVAARVVGPDEAEDVAQEAFLRCLSRLPQYRATGSFRAWLLQIAHRTALDAVRRRRPLPVDPEGEAQVAVRDDDRSRQPARQLEARERRDRLERKLLDLREEHRVVLVLRDLEGFAYDEIADATEAPIGTVKGRLFRARKELIDLLRNNTYDWDLPR